MDTRAVKIVYTNYKGITAERCIVPISVEFGSSPWHPEPQWLLKAMDMDKQQERSFAIKDIRSWSPAMAENLSAHS
jgi:hypothetical protein